MILTIAGRDIRDAEDLLYCVKGRVEGEQVPVGLLRGGQRQDLILSLAAEIKPFAGFPTFFEHDMPLTPDECGGPVVDLAGEVVGVTLYSGDYGCMAIPSRLRQATPAGAEIQRPLRQMDQATACFANRPRTFWSGRETSEGNESTNAMN